MQKYDIKIKIVLILQNDIAFDNRRYMQNMIFTIFMVGLAFKIYIKCSHRYTADTYADIF